MSSASPHILSLIGLDVSYGGVQAVRGFTLDVGPGEVVGLVGESGSGKSSVLRAVAGLLSSSGKVSGGSIEFKGEDLAKASRKRMAQLRGREVSYVFQDPVATLDPLFKIGSQFEESIRACGASPEGGARKLECSLLEEMGFEDPERVLASYPHELSGGMCQRVVLAMSVACNPALMLADEPTSALDVTSQGYVSNLLLRARDQHGCAILMVSHNIGAVSLVADRIGVMYKGELVEVGERDQVLYEPVHPYTRNLIAAVPRADGSMPKMPEHWEGE